MSEYSIYLFLMVAFILSACDQKKEPSQSEQSKNSVSEKVSNDQVSSTENTAILNKLYADHERDYEPFNHLQVWLT